MGKQRRQYTADFKFQVALEATTVSQYKWSEIRKQSA